MPQVSICLATYNGERFLKAQIDSLLAQTFADFEIVVSDGGSTDATCDMLAEYARKDPRVRVLPEGGRLGVQKNFERVISAASGQCIAPCDQDDIWHADKLAALLACLRARNAALAYCDSALMEEDGRPTGVTLLETLPMKIEGHDALPFAFYNCVSGHAMLFDRAILQHALPFPDEPIYDWWLATVAAAAGGIALLDRPLVQYRRHSQSVTNLALHVESEKLRDDLRALNAQDCRRFAAFARAPGQAGRDYARLTRLWAGLPQRWFAPRLALFLFRHPSLLAPRNKSPASNGWQRIKLARGIEMRERARARRERRRAKRRARRARSRLPAP